jgi:hypothetical protein
MMNSGNFENGTAETTSRQARRQDADWRHQRQPARISIPGFSSFDEFMNAEV